MKIFNGFTELIIVILCLVALGLQIAEMSNIGMVVLWFVFFLEVSKKQPE